MSFLGSMLGNSTGSGFTPQGTNSDQTGTAYNQTQSGINQQQQFVNALGQQNGLGNQSQVFNQLQGVVNGTGPNPAQAQLNQATGQNVANQAALMAGQRGSNANAGLIARQAAMQGANAQQQAVGQGASLQANQSLNALGQTAGIANQQVAQQQQGLSALNSNSLQQQGNLLGIQANQNSTGAGIAGGNQSAQANLTGNLMGGVGGAAMSMLADGGPVGAPGASADQGAVNGQLISGQNALNPSSIPGMSGNMGTMGTTGSGPQSNVGKSMNSGLQSGMQMGQKIANQFKSNDPSGSATNMSDDATQEAYLNADNQLGVSGADNSQVDLGASNLDSTAGTVSDMDPYGLGAGQSGASTSIGGEASAGNALGGGADELSGVESGLGDFFGGESGTAVGEAGQGVGDFFSGLGDMFGSIFDLGAEGAGNIAGGAADAVGSGEAAGVGAGLAEEGGAVAAAAKGGGVHRNVPALVSPGEHILSPQDVQKVARGASPMAVSKKVPGKPKVGGSTNNYANDTVPKNLAEGSIVLPRSVTQSANPQWAAHKFVSQIMAKNGSIPKKGK